MLHEIEKIRDFHFVKKCKLSNEGCRKKLKLSQSAFAVLMGVSPRTIQDWEQGRRRPQGPAKSLLRIAEHHPEIFIETR
jgi:DNA-binding transcriptional regulator YiaG